MTGEILWMADRWYVGYSRQHTCYVWHASDMCGGYVWQVTYYVRSTGGNRRHVMYGWQVICCICTTDDMCGIDHRWHGTYGRQVTCVIFSTGVILCLADRWHVWYGRQVTCDVWPTGEKCDMNNHRCTGQKKKKMGRSSHHLDMERLIGRSAYLILEGQICLPFG